VVVTEKGQDLSRPGAVDRLGPAIFKSLFR
jgi:hypothetical protein